VTARDWSEIGRRDPYFGVLSVPDYRGATLAPETLEAFYATGRDDIARLLSWIREDLAVAPQGDALDIGCGVGRLSLALAPHVTSIAGYDVSPTMLQHAAARARSKAVSNASFSTSLPDGPFDFFISYLVFQHIPEPQGLALLSEALRRAAPRAILAVQFLFWRDPDLRPPRHPVSRLVDALRRARARRGATEIDPLIQMHDYDAGRVAGAAFSAGFSRIVFRRHDQGGHRGVWLIARRDA